MKQLLFIGLLWFATVQVTAQSENVDSLVNVLETQNLNVEEQLKLYHKIAKTFVLYDLEKSSEYVTKGLKLAEKEKNNVMISEFYDILGRIYGTKADFDSTLIYFNKSLDFAIEAKDKELEAGAYNGIGITYARREMPVPALEYFKKSLSIYENTTNKMMCIRLMSNIGTLYRSFADVQASLNYLENV
jgi:tetratricopeptide (TPR) repeat protein